MTPVDAPRGALAGRLARRLNGWPALGDGIIASRLYERAVRSNDRPGGLANALVHRLVEPGAFAGDAPMGPSALVVAPRRRDAPAALPAAAPPARDELPLSALLRAAPRRPSLPAAFAASPPPSRQTGDGVASRASLPLVSALRAATTAPAPAHGAGTPQGAGAANLAPAPSPAIDTPAAAGPVPALPTRPSVAMPAPALRPLHRSRPAEPASGSPEGRPAGPVPTVRRGGLGPAWPAGAQMPSRAPRAAPPVTAPPAAPPPVAPTPPGAGVLPPAPDVLPGAAAVRSPAVAAPIGGSGPRSAGITRSLMRRARPATVVAARGAGGHVTARVPGAIEPPPRRVGGVRASGAGTPSSPPATRPLVHAARPSAHAAQTARAPLPVAARARPDALAGRDAAPRRRTADPRQGTPPTTPAAGLAARAAAVDTELIAEQVYGLFVRRLASERARRGY